MHVFLMKLLILILLKHQPQCLFELVILYSVVVELLLELANLID